MRRATIAIDDVHRQPILQLNAIARTDSIEKGERVAVAAEEHVLSVVDPLTGSRIGERTGTAADRRPRLEHQHAGTALGKACRRREPGASGADDNDVRSIHRASSRAPTGAAQSARVVDAAPESGG